MQQRVHGSGTFTLATLDMRDIALWANWFQLPALCYEKPSSVKFSFVHSLHRLSGWRWGWMSITFQAICGWSHGPWGPRCGCSGWSRLCRTGCWKSCCLFCGSSIKFARTDFLYYKCNGLHWRADPWQWWSWGCGELCGVHLPWRQGEAFQGYRWNLWAIGYSSTFVNAMRTLCFFFFKDVSMERFTMAWLCSCQMLSTDHSFDLLIKYISGLMFNNLRVYLQHSTTAKWVQLVLFALLTNQFHLLNFEY